MRRRLCASSVMQCALPTSRRRCTRLTTRRSTSKAALAVRRWPAEVAPTTRRSTSSQNAGARQFRQLLVNLATFPNARRRKRPPRASFGTQGRRPAPSVPSPPMRRTSLRPYSGSGLLRTRCCPGTPRPFHLAPRRPVPSAPHRPPCPRTFRCAAKEEKCPMCVGFGVGHFAAGASESEKPRSRIWQLIGIRARSAKTYAHRAFF